MTCGASLSWLWGNPAHADVTLQLCTTQAVAKAASTQEPSSPSHAVGAATAAAAAEATQHQGPAKVGRSSRASAPESARAPQPQAGLHEAAAAASCARSYLLHASVLGSCSPYFKKRTTPLPPLQDGGAGGSGDGDFAGLQFADAPAVVGEGSCPLCGSTALLVEHVEEGELESVEAVLRHCYTGQLCEDGGGAAQLCVTALLQMLVLADRFDLPLCLAHCGKELGSRPAAEYDILTVNAVLGGLTPGAQSLDRAAITSAATARLLQLLGDAEAVGDAWYDPASSTLHTQLLQVSHPALLASDRLRARSENSLLMLADTWVCNSPAGAACSQGELRRVAEAVRLGLLSHTYVFDVLPELPWLQLSGAESASLMRFATADAKRRASLVEYGRLAGPEEWYAQVDPRDAWAPENPLVHDWGGVQGGAGTVAGHGRRQPAV